MSEDTSKRILDGALKMFTQNGIKSITMDEIAESLSISKRTIYENFKDKNTLVFECLKYMDQIIDTKMKQICRECDNTMVEMMATTQEMQRILKSVNPKFLNDVKGLNLPNDYCRQKEMERQIRYEMRLTKGQEEGLIRKELPVTLLSTSISEGIRQMAEKAIKENPSIQIYKIINTFIKIFYRGIATEKGLKIIENYEKENPSV
ncbi:MAG: TetR/AcrR family transcriptional regulator [Paludibacteraceae bacterium]|nr:TetR/AcrR family transcriptional regulator [Paludibacteraceae bacterium]MBR6103963.1 TetR/AcrR family transcriptional regulator [Paludibacteraceae bacterium]